MIVSLFGVMIKIASGAREPKMWSLRKQIRRVGKSLARGFVKGRNRLALFKKYMQLRREERQFDRVFQKFVTQNRSRWREVIGDALSFPKFFREQQAQLESMKLAYFSAEPFLQVARSPIPREFSWRAQTHIVFEHGDLPGELQVAWENGTIAGSHLYSWMPDFGGSGFYEIKLPAPGKLRGRKTLGTVTSDDGMIVIDAVSGLFKEGMPSAKKSTRFSARSIKVRYSNEPSSFARYIYRGIELRGAPDPSQFLEQDEDGNGSVGFRRDSFETVIFDRRARVTQLRQSEDPEDQFLAVTLAGPALAEAEEHLLWEAVSFVAGGRSQVYTAEEFDSSAACVSRRYLGGVLFGPTSDPPFDLRLAHMAFDRSGWTQVTEGFARVRDEGYPLGIALHHLHNANDGFYQVEIKNLLLCIHSLFEYWADLHKKRRIMSRRPFERGERSLKACATQFFEGEALESVRESIHYANERTGALLQELFFESMGVSLTEPRLRALKRRNKLFHRGYIPHDPNNETELQELIDDAHALRTLAHLAFLKLAGYKGPLLDYETYETILCE